MGYRGIPLRFFSHAREKMKERQVSFEDVRETTEAPDTEYPSTETPGARVLTKRFSQGFRVSVVIMPPTSGDPEVKIITTWADRGEE